MRIQATIDRNDRCCQAEAIRRQRTHAFAETSPADRRQHQAVRLHQSGSGRRRRRDHRGPRPGRWLRSSSGSLRCRRVRLSHLSAEERRAYVLADNKLALNAGWDTEILAIELQALIDLDFDVDADRLLAGRDRPVARSCAGGVASEPKTVPRTSFPTCQPMRSRSSATCGMLGRHRLLCGDARSAADLYAPHGWRDSRSDLHRSALQRRHRRQCRRARLSHASRVRVRLRRDERGRVHRIPDGHALERSAVGEGRRHRVCLHGLASHARAARRRRSRLHRAQEPLRLEQDQWRHGQLLSLQARAGLCLQDRHGARTPTPSGLARPAATAPMSGTMPASAVSAPTAWISLPCIRRSSRSRSLPMPSKTARGATRSCSTSSAAPASTLIAAEELRPSRQADRIRPALLRHDHQSLAALHRQSGNA